MTPFFSPDKGDLGDFGVPKIYLAGVGELMTEVAGEVCDGFLCHGFTTEKYLREVTLPALERGRAKAGKTMDGFDIVGPSFVVTGTDDSQMEQAASGSPTTAKVLRISSSINDPISTHLPCLLRVFSSSCIPPHPCSSSTGR